MMIDLFRPTRDDIPKLKSVYLECFDEDIKAADFMFENMLLPKYAYAARLNGAVVAALYLLPCEIALENGKTARSHYLMGAGTSKAFRRLGIMGKLITYCCEAAKENGDKYSVLRPADASLFDYYRRFGYKSIYNTTIFDFDLNSNVLTGKKHLDLTKISFDIWSRLRFNICMTIMGSVCWSRLHLAHCAKICEIYGGGILGCDDGYILYTNDGTTPFVEEMICLPENADTLLKSFCEEIGVKRARVRCPSVINRGGSQAVGMIKPLDKSLSAEDLSHSAYLGLSLD